jgi:hypothetical protein
MKFLFIGAAAVVVATIAPAGASSPSVPLRMHAGAVPAGGPAQRQDQGTAALLITTSSLPVEDVSWPDTTPSVVPAYVVMELDIAGTPCFDCVNGKTKGTFGSGYPLGYVNTNTSSLGVLFEWFDVSFTSTCSISATLTLGGKVLKTASGSFKPTVGSVENTLMGVTRSSTWHGLATMVGKAVCGGTTAEAKGSVHFQ